MPLYSSTYQTTPDKAIDKFFNHRPYLEEEWRDLFDEMLASGTEYYSDEMERSVLLKNYWTFKARLEYDGKETYISLRLKY